MKSTTKLITILLAVAIIVGLCGCNETTKPTPDASASQTVENSVSPDPNGSATADTTVTQGVTATIDITVSPSATANTDITVSPSVTATADGTADPTPTSTVKPEQTVDPNQVIAQVNGQDISVKDWGDIYHEYAKIYQMYGYDPNVYPDFYNSLKNEVLTSLIKETILEQKAREAGLLEYTDQERQQTEAKVKQEFENNIKARADAIYRELSSEGKDYRYCYDKAEQEYYEYLDEQGWTLESIVNDELRLNGLQKYYDYYFKDEKVPDSEVEDAYNELKQYQQEEFIGEKADSNAFTYAWNSGDHIVVIPEGYSLVQHILISFDDYDEDAAKEKADQIFNAVKGGDEAKFIQEMLKHTADSGMCTQEMAQAGYLIGEGDGMVEEFHDAAMALKKDGDISEPVRTDYGYHIIRRMKALQARNGNEQDDYTAKIKQEIKLEMLEAIKAEKWEEIMKTWYQDGIDSGNIIIHKEVVDAYPIV